MKWFAYQRGPRGPEPVVFHDEPPKGKSHVLGLIDSTLKQVPAELADLPVAELAQRMKGVS